MRDISPRNSENKSLISASGNRRLPEKAKREDVFDFSPECIFKKFEDLSREIFSVFDDLFDNMPGMRDVQDYQITQTEDDIVIKAKLQGLSTDNLDVNIDEDFVRVSGKQQTCSEYRGLDNGLFRSQKSFSAFYRKIPLPVKVKCHDARVNYDGEELMIVIPREKN